jgi:hypothetical protein
MVTPDLDIFTEPEFDVHTLAHLGPLHSLAGVWEGTGGLDTHPIAEGLEQQAYVEHYDLQPIDPQTNGPQLLYGLRYHVHITRPGEIETFHDQVGYWLYEPATSTIFLTIAIPRVQVALASGSAAKDATEFTVVAERGLETFGICSGPYLEHAFTTTNYSMRVTIGNDDTWSYEQDTILQVLGSDRPFHHLDHNTLHRVAPPTPNPLAR